MPDTGGVNLRMAHLLTRPDFEALCTTWLAAQQRSRMIAAVVASSERFTYEERSAVCWACANLEVQASRDALDMIRRALRRDGGEVVVAEDE